MATYTLENTLDMAPETTAQENLLEYRSLSTTAVIGFLLGGLSILVVLSASTSLEATFLVTPIPIIGFFISLKSFLAIRQRPTELTGKMLAVIGMTLSLVFLVTGFTYASYVYSTEVPDGYKRIAFTELEPTQVQQESGKLVPPEIIALEGEEIFIKGYIRPTTARTNLTRFLLVRDNNECCFGDINKVKYHDQIQVELTKPLMADYSRRIFRVGGKIRVRPRNAIPGSGRPVFTLVADYLQ